MSSLFQSNPRRLRDNAGSDSGGRGRPGQQGGLLNLLITHIRAERCTDCDRGPCADPYNLKYTLRTCDLLVPFLCVLRYGFISNPGLPGKGGTFCASAWGWVSFPGPRRQAENSSRGRRHWGRAPKGGRVWGTDTQTACTAVQSLPTGLVD